MSRMRWMLLFACVIVFAGSSYKLIASYEQSRHSDKLNQSLREGVGFDQRQPQSLKQTRYAVPYSEPIPSQSSSTVSQQPEMLSGYESKRAQNSDFVGWITVPHTNIDYPVVQTEDNDYYLEHDFEQKKSENGSVFMDFRNDPLATDSNTILYGHYTWDGTIFSELKAYRKKTFLQDNPIITFNTLHEQSQWEVFSVYVTSTDFYYIQTQFRSKRDYGDFLAEIQNKSMYDTGVDISTDDQILTLSTCAYDFDNARLVVHARKIQS